MEIDIIDSKFKLINRNNLIGWVVFYWENNRLIRYTSETHDWLNLPKIGVQFLFRIYTSHKEQVVGCDYYCPYQLMDVDDIRPWIKFGLYLDDEIFNNKVWPVVREDIINR